MERISRRWERLTPWYLGLLIVVAVVTFVGHRMWNSGCPAPTFVELGVLLVVSAVYLAVVYLTVVSQE